MKRFVTFVAAVVVAAPLLAQDQSSPSSQQKPAEQPKPKAQPAATVTPAPAADSPMVAAAKRTKRTGKKVITITNDNLSKDGSSNAHITTAKEGRDINLPEPDAALIEYRNAPARDKAIKEQQAQAAAEKAKRDAKKDEKLRAAAAQQEMNGPYGDDPAANEKILEELAKKQQQQDQKPPM